MLYCANIGMCYTVLTLMCVTLCYTVLHCVVACLICVQSASALARTGKGRSAEEKKRDEE